MSLPDSSADTPGDGGSLSPWAWLGLLLSLAMTWWFVSDIQWGQIGVELRAVKLGLVALAAGLLLSEFVLRALRWQLVLRPAAATARVRDLFSASVVGAAGNTLLPMRAGEVARALVAMHRTRVRLATVFATNLMERVYDLFGLVAVLVTMLILLPSDLGASGGDEVLVVNLKRYGALLGGAALLAMVGFFSLASAGKRSRKLILWALRPLPQRIQSRVADILDAFIEGFSSAGSFRLLCGSIFYSLILWFNGSLAIYVLFQAFDLDLPYSAACFTTVAIALTVVLPQAPGFFGVFHVAIEKTLVLWQVPEAPAEAFAIVFWAVSFVPVTAVGLAALWREGLSLGGLWKDRGALGD